MCGGGGGGGGGTLIFSDIRRLEPFLGIQNFEGPRAVFNKEGLPQDCP